MPALDQSEASSHRGTNERRRLVAGRVELSPHSATDSLNGRFLSLPLHTTNTKPWPTPLRQPRKKSIFKISQTSTNFSLFSPTTEVPVAEKSAEAEAVPEVASNGDAAAKKEESTTNGDATKETKEAETTNGSTEVPNGASEEVPASSNGSTEAEEKKEETSSEAVKRKAEGEEEEETEDVSAEKIAKLKEVAAEKLNEAEEKLPAEPLTEAEAVA